MTVFLDTLSCFALGIFGRIFLSPTAPRRAVRGATQSPRPWTPIALFAEEKKITAGPRSWTHLRPVPRFIWLHSLHRDLTVVIQNVFCMRSWNQIFRYSSNNSFIQFTFSCRMKFNLIFAVFCMVVLSWLCYNIPDVLPIPNFAASCPEKTVILNVNKNPTKCNSMQILIYCKVILRVSGVTAPIIRSTKNSNRSLRYRS